MDPIDELFRKGLDGHGLEYDQGEWDKVEGALEKGSGISKFNISNYGVGFLGLAALVLLYVMWPSHEDKQVVEMISQEMVSNEEVVEQMPMSDKLETGHESVPRVQAKLQQEYISGSSEHSAQSEPVGGEALNRLEPTANVNAQEEVNVVENSAPKEEEVLAHSVKAGSEFRDKSNIIMNCKPLSDGLKIDEYPTPFLVSVPESHRKRWELWTSIYGFSSMHTRNISGLIEDASLQKARETSVRQNSYGAGVVLKHQGLSVSIGVEKLNLLERTNYLSTGIGWNYDTTLVLVLRENEQDPRGGYIALLENQIDSSSYSYPVEACPDCEVKFEYVSIPVGIQYEIGMRRVSWFGEVGGTIGLLQSSGGRYVVRGVNEQDTAGSMIGELDYGQVVNKVIYHANVALGMRYRISSDASVWGSYNYGVGLNSLISSYKQKVDVQRIYLGLEYKIF